MYIALPPAFLLAIFTIITLTLSVDINFVSTRRSQTSIGRVIYSRCTNIPESACCTPIFGTTVIPTDIGSFDNLPINALSAFYSWHGSPNLPANRGAGCGQQQVRCTFTTPTWSYTAPPSRPSATTTRDVITGADWWISPLRDRWGLLSGAAAAIDDAIDVVNAACRSVMSVHGAGISSRKRDRRRGSENGLVMPGKSILLPAWVYPDVVTWNGTEYTDEHRNDLVYRDSTGNVLDLRLLS